jgi:hypothetical protein
MPGAIYEQAYRALQVFLFELPHFVSELLTGQEA